MSITTNQRTSLFTLLKPYDCFADQDSFIEITEWSNGEGYDVNIVTNHREQLFQITHGEFEALTVLMHYKK